jgi:hypothetical protein
VILRDPCGTIGFVPVRRTSLAANARTLAASALLAAFALAAFALVASAMLGSPQAIAQPRGGQLRVGLRALESADFQRAIRAFDRAERSDTLERDALVSLYEGRIIARFAIGASSRARRDLQALAALDPGHRFPVEVPPEVSDAFAVAVAESGGGLAARVAWSDAGDSSTLRVEVLRDTAELVREVRVHVRVGQGAWSTTTERELRLDRRGDAIAAYVELVGARGAVLAREGSAESPIVHGLPRIEVEPEDVPSVTSSDGDAALALGLGIGGAVLAAVAVVVGVVLGTQTSTQTQPMAPFVVGF